MLVGKDGARVLFVKITWYVVEQHWLRENTMHKMLPLSIDEKLQSMVYRNQKAVTENKVESGTAVLVDACTGEVLAMATAPSYNPNNLR